MVDIPLLDFGSNRLLREQMTENPSNLIGWLSNIRSGREALVLNRQCAPFDGLSGGDMGTTCHGESSGALVPCIKRGKRIAKLCALDQTTPLGID
jgi:hypothetical protein